MVTDLSADILHYSFASTWISFGRGVHPALHDIYIDRTEQDNQKKKKTQ